MADLEKLPLLSGQFVWIVSRTDGKMSLAVGPAAFDVKDDEFLLVPDPTNYRRLLPVSKEHAMKAVQDYIYIEDDEYAVIHNPTESFSKDHPNGRLDKDKNPTITLLPGQKRIVTSGSIPVWPRQKVVKHKIHRLLASEYLMAMVVSEEIDPNAPYYDVTMKCADIKTALADETVGSEGAVESIKEKDPMPASGEAGENVSSEQKEDKGNSEEKPEADKTSQSQDKGESDPGDIPPVKLKVGQRIIIPGSQTPTYIPPTGIEVVLVETEDKSETTVAKKVELTPAERLEQLISTGVIKIETLESALERIGLEDNWDAIRTLYSRYKEANKSRGAVFNAITQYLDTDDISRLNSLYPAETAGKNSSLENVSADDSAVRQAVVLGPTEFCVLVDENGSPTTHIGPGRVFPGPNDTFRTAGSRDRVYDMYHLKPNRGLLLRVVADEIKKTDLAKRLPKACLKQLDKDIYYKGDEIFIGGFDAYLAPHSNSFEVIDPGTLNPHIGNSHGGVYVQAIGVDQQSGIYVQDVETGNVELVKGETKVLLDPRKKKHLIRTVPGSLWNLTVGHTEPHKKVSEASIVDTPWAFSVNVPNNMAMLLTSRSGRRTIMGPQTTLLEYDEVPEVVKISVGRPKTERETRSTVFLWVSGNRPTDKVELITADKAVVNVDVQYEVEFYADNEKEQEKWFLYKNYVWMLVSNTRSRLRNAAEKISFAELKDNISDFVRNVILGEKPEGEKAHRPGLVFDSCNLKVIEVEVLDWQVDDADVAAALAKANKQSVTREIDDSALRAELESAKERDRIEAERAKLDLSKAERAAETDLAKAKITDQAAAEKLQLQLANHERLEQAEVAKTQIAEQTAVVKSEINLRRATREAEDQVARAKISEQAANEQADLEKARTARNEELSLLKFASDTKVKQATADLGHKLDLVLVEMAAELAAKRDQERTRSAGVERSITEADTRSIIALKDESRTKVAAFRKTLAEVNIALAEGEAKADATRIAALQEKLVEAIEGLGNKQVLAELAKHLPEATGSLGLLLGKGGVQALSELLKGMPLKDAVNPLFATSREVADAANQQTATVPGSENDDDVEG